MGKTVHPSTIRADGTRIGERDVARLGMLIDTNRKAFPIKLKGFSPDSRKKVAQAIIDTFNHLSRRKCKTLRDCVDPNHELVKIVFSRGVPPYSRPAATLESVLNTILPLKKKGIC